MRKPCISPSPPCSRGHRPPVAQRAHFTPLPAPQSPPNPTPMRTHPLSWPLLAAACLLSSCITQHPALPDQAKLRTAPQDFNRPGPLILVTQVDGQEPASDKRDYSIFLTAGPHAIELETKIPPLGRNPANSSPSSPGNSPRPLPPSTRTSPHRRTRSRLPLPLGLAEGKPPGIHLNRGSHSRRPSRLRSATTHCPQMEGPLQK